MSDLLFSDERLNQKHWSDLRIESSPFRSAFEYAAIGMVVADIGFCVKRGIDIVNLALKTSNF